jgi:hypothetical protein
LPHLSLSHRRPSGGTGPLAIELNLLQPQPFGHLPQIGRQRQHALLIQTRFFLMHRVHRQAPDRPFGAQINPRGNPLVVQERQHVIAVHPLVLRV